MALLPVEMRIGDKIVKGSQAVDLIVHPEFRRKGIFLAIGRFITNDAGEKEDISYGAHALLYCVRL